MSSGCGDVLSLEDLKTAKKHQLFEAEVITGKQGGVAGGADIDYATNQATGQVQKTMPAVLRDVGFTPVSWDFSTGGTLGASDRDKVVYDPVSKTWYSYAGTLPVTVPAGFNPVGNADWKPQTDPNLREELASSTGASLIGWQGETVGQHLDTLNTTVDKTTLRSDDPRFATLQDWAASAGKNKVLVGGTYPISSTLEIKGENVTIEGNCIFQPDAPMVALRFGSQTRTLLTSLTAPTVKGITNFTVNGVAQGDTVCFWNPANGSWSAFRDNWRQGEFLKVAKYSDGVAYFDSGLIDAYPIGTEVYKVDIVPLNIEARGNITVTYPSYNGGSAGVEILQATGNIQGLSVIVNEAPIAVHVKRCFTMAMSAITAIQNSASTGNTDYGLIVSNSQNLSGKAVKASAGRHGITMGGNGETCSIVNRNNHFEGEFRTTGLGNVAGADHHGNCENCSYRGYAQGLVFGGDNNDYQGMYIDYVPTKPDWMPVLASELRGTNFNLSNMTVYCPGNPGNVRGVIDISGNSAELGPNTKNPGVINLSNTQIFANSATYVLNIRDWGVPVNYSVNCTGLIIRGTAGNTAIRITPGSGTHVPTFVSLAGNMIPRGMNIVIDTANGVVIEGLRLSGTVSVPVSAGAASGTTSVAFNRTMPAGVKVQVSRSGIVAGAGSAKMALTSLNASTTGFDIEAYTVDAAGVVSARSETVNWSAEW